MRVSLLLFLFQILFFINGFSQSFKFRNYTIKEGLPQDYIYTIVQSKQGELWVGTGEGLAKFDGKEFIRFSDKDGFKNNFVTSSFKDKEQNIWTGHFNGAITFYDNNNFKSLSISKVSNSPVNTFFQDKKGNIWAGSKANGLLKINKNLSVQVFNEVIEGGINCITEDSEGNLWIGTDRGLIKTYFSNGKLAVIERFFPETSIQSLWFDNNSLQLLVGSSEEGLLSVNTATNSTSQVNNIFEDENINLLIVDRDGYLWVSVYGSGIYKCKFIDGKIESQDHFFEGSGLVSNYVKSLYSDRENNIWFGTYGSGLSQLLDQTFTIYTKSDGLPENNIKAIDKDISGNLFVATDNRVSVLPIGTPEFSILEGIHTNSDITSLKTLDSFLLIGTEGEGVLKYSIAKKTLTPFLKFEKNNLLNRVNHIEIDRYKNIWVATDGGLISFYKHCNCSTVYTMEQGLPHNKIYGLYADSRNRIWLATHGAGLSYIKNDEISVFPSPLENRSLELNCFAEDKLGGLWLGSFGQGFFLFQNGKFLKKYDNNQLLGSPYCYFLIFDKEDKLWIGHKNGLSRFNTSKEEFIFFEKDEENILAEVNHKAALRDPSGELWFGTVNGLIKYNPKAETPKISGPIVNLNSILLNYQTVDWNDYTDSTYFFGKIPYRLTLPYNQNHLTFNVAGVSLRPGGSKIKYQYKLEGFEQDWALVTNEPFVTYAHLPPGIYTLKIRAGSKNGIWTELDQPFTFIIRSPFWKTWWFISATILGCFFLITSYVKVRTDRLKTQREKLRKDKQILEAEIRERIKAQQQQKLVEEKLKQTNQELNNFIYRSSHDLRGPISTVKGLTQLGAIEVKDAEAQKFFSLILDRTHVLDSVLKNLINIVEVIEGEIICSHIDFKEIFDKNYEEFYRSSKEATFELRFTCFLLKEFYNDLNLIDTVFKNIIDNSLKYRRSNIDSFLSIEVKESREGVTMKFEDNGIGISDEIRPRIFDMFYRGTDESKGSGLGLYTVKKIVDKLNGTIEVMSSVNKGTTIIIYLPKIQN